MRLLGCSSQVSNKRQYSPWTHGSHPMPIAILSVLTMISLSIGTCEFPTLCLFRWRLPQYPSCSAVLLVPLHDEIWLTVMCELSTDKICRVHTLHVKISGISCSCSWCSCHIHCSFFFGFRQGRSPAVLLTWFLLNPHEFYKLISRMVLCFIEVSEERALF